MPSRAGSRLLALAASRTAPARQHHHGLAHPARLRVPSYPSRLPLQHRLALSATTTPRRDAPGPGTGSDSARSATRDDDPFHGGAGAAGGAAPEPSVLAKMAESAATTLASVLVLALGFAGAGYAYHKFYKHLVLQKISNAFEPGDPVLELAAVGRGIPPPPDSEHWIMRDEQPHINDVIAGKARGHYLLILGEKGSGKSSMLLEAMRNVNGDGCSMFEAHADLEIFRARLGKALDYEYHEDYIGGYFSEKGPRESTALLDIERALNKLEKVAVKRRLETGKPLVLIVNQVHLLRDDEDGKDLLELLQQRAEQWAAANVVTMIFNSDDYWVYERFKLLATRMEVLPITDLPKPKAIAALRSYRERYFQHTPDPEMLEEVYDRVGGRLSFLNRVARSRDMLETCDVIKEIEKTWLLNQCWILGEPMDDDVMDQQKWASASMALALALVDKEMEMDKTYCPEAGHVLPWFPFHKAQEVMTRCDFIRELDRLNLFTITSTAQVRASSVPMHRAFREICSEPGFREYLEETMDRIAAIESLGRTRELVAKDLVLGGKYEITKTLGGVEVTLKEKEEEEKGDEKDD